MGQVNVKISDEKERQLDLVAAAMGMQRPDFLRKIYDEAIFAHENGGVAFAQGDGMRIDLKASELLLQVKDLLVENERSRRENLKLSERLLKASNGGEEAYRHALEELTNRLVAQRKEANIPFLEQVNQLRADMAALPDAIGHQVSVHFAPMEDQLVTIAQEARAPRLVRNLVVGREFVQEWPVMATMSGLCFFSSILFLLIAGNFVPGLGRSLANQFVDHDVALCRQLNHRFSTKECALPDLRQRTAMIAIDLEDRP
jgi:hypothetical protein